MPDDIRIKKIASFFRNELTRIITREFKNPLFENALISFPEIKISRDLSQATVSVSVLGEDGIREKIVDALNKASGLIRQEIKSVSELRRIPMFTFKVDTTMEKAAELDMLLDSLKIPEPEPESEPE